MNSIKIHCCAFACLFLCANHTSFAQLNEKIYFDELGNVATENSASFYVISQQSKKDKNLLIIKTFYITGAKKSEGNYIIKIPIETIDLSSYPKPEFWLSAVNDGPYKVWYGSGKIAEEGLYKAGLKDGTYKEYFENGKIKSETNNKDGKAEGLLSIYYENGNLRLQFMMVDNKLQGELKSYFENGKIDTSKKFINNNDTGETKMWDPEGNEIISEE